ncbi:MAG: type II toxin-antitoxin system HicB family antitoxin [Dehalococcoidia bacterium]
MVNIGERQGYVVLTGVVEREGDQFVSYCRELGTSSCGDTAEEAFANLGDAIEVHIEALIETGELQRTLREKNIRIDLEPLPGELSVRVAPGQMFTTYPRSVPVPDPA